MAALTATLCLVLLLTSGLSQGVSGDGDGGGIEGPEKDEGGTSQVDNDEASTTSSILPTTGSTLAPAPDVDSTPPTNTTDSATDSTE